MDVTRVFRQTELRSEEIVEILYNLLRDKGESLLDATVPTPIAQPPGSQRGLALTRPRSEEWSRPRGGRNDSKQ
jgi:hypothetical protein